jgi:hypothetical protein
MYTLKAKTPIREIETKTEAYLQKYASFIEAIIEVIDNLNNNCPLH